MEGSLSSFRGSPTRSIISSGSPPQTRKAIGQYLPINSSMNRNMSGRSVYSIQSNTSLDDVKQLRTDLVKMRKSFVSDFNKFEAVIESTKNAIYNLFLNRGSNSPFLKSNDFLNMSDGRVKALEKQVYELSEKLKVYQMDDNNLALVKLQDDLSEKEAYIKDIESEYEQEITQLKQQLIDQNEIINDFKSQRFHLVQLQAQLDEKNRAIDRLKKENERTADQLNTQVQCNETAADDIQYTMGAIDSLRSSLMDEEEKSKKLTKEIEQIKELLKAEKNKSGSLYDQVSESNNQIEQLKTILSNKDKEIEVLKHQNSQATQEIAEKDLAIDEHLSEISILTAEKALSPRPPDKNQIPTIQSTANELTINSKIIQKYKMENLSLKSQIEKLHHESKEQQNLISALKLNLQQSEESLNHTKDQLINSQSSFDRKETRMHSFKEEIIRLQGVISQKEILISELMTVDNERGKELERLHKELELSKKKPSEPVNIDEKLHKQFTDISQELAKSKSIINSLDISNKQLNSEIKELKEENDSMKHKISQGEKEITRLNQENGNLRASHETTRIQSETTIKKLQRELYSLQDQFESTVNENKGFSEKYNNLMKNIQTNTEKADKLFVENNELKKENAQLLQHINVELKPMVEENKRLKAMLEKIKNTERIITDDNTRMFTENAILKKTSVKEISILKQSLISKEEQITQYEKDIEIMKVELDKYRDDMRKLFAVYRKDSFDTILDQSKDNISKISQLKKANMDQASLISQLQNETKALNNEVSECRSQILVQAQTIDARVKDLNIAKESNNILQNKIAEIEVALKTKSHDVQSHENVIEQLQNEIDSIQEVIEFSTIESLKVSIKQLQDQNAELINQKEEGLINIDKLTSEKRKLEMQINDLTKKNALQESQIERLKQKLDEARSTMTEESTNSHTTTVSLRKQIDEKENEIELMKYEFERFHSIISFAKVDDLFSTVSSLLDSKNQEIEKLTFANSQTITKYNQKITEMGNSIEKLQNQVKGLYKVKDEKAFFSNQVKLLEAEVKASKNEQQQAESELEALNQRLERIVLALSTFTKCENAKDIEVVLDGLRSKLALRKEKLKEANSQYNTLQEENSKLKSEIESVKSSSFTERNTNQRKEIESKMKDNENLVYFGVNSIDQLQQKYNDMQKTIEKYQIQVKTQDIEIQKLNDQIKLKVASIENITNERDSLTQVNQTLVRKFTEIEEQYLELRDKSITLQKNNAKIIEDNKELKNQQQNRSEEKQSAAARLQALTNEKANLSNQVRDLSKANQRMSLEVTDLTTEIQTLKARISSLETENTSYYQENNNLTLKNTTLVAQITKVKAENDELTKILKVNSESKKRMNEQITELETKVEALSNEKETTTSHNATLQSKFSKYSEKIETTQEKLGKVTEDLEVALIQVKTLETKCEAQQTQIAKLVEQNKKYYDNFQAALTKFEQTQIESRHANSKVRSLDLQVKRLLAENQDLNKNADNDNNELDDLRVEAQSLRIDKQSLIEDNNFLKQENEKICKQLDEIVTENDKLKNDLRLLKNKVASVENETKSIRQQNIAFSKQNQQLTSDNKDLIANNRLLLSKNSTYNVQKKSIMDSNEALTKQNEELKALVSSLQIDCNTQVAQIKSLTTQLDNVQQKYAQLTVSFEDANSKAKQAISDLQVAKTSVRTLTANNKGLQKRNETLVADNEKLSTDITTIRMTAVETASKNSDLEEQVLQMKELIQQSSERIKALINEKQENQSKIVKLKKRLRLSNKQIAELESAKRELVVQANELEDLKDNLRDIVEGRSAIEAVKNLIKMNDNLMETMDKSKKQNEQYHRETDKTIKQCNDFMTSVFDMINDGNVQEFALPLTPQEMDETIKKVVDYKQMCKQNELFLDRIKEEAGNIGFEGDDYEGAILCISRFISEKATNGEVEELHRTITDITSASDKRKQQSREYLDKIKGKLLKAHRKNDVLREIIAQLINLKVESENLNLQVLIDNLTDEELEILGIDKNKVLSSG